MVEPIIFIFFCTLHKGIMVIKKSLGKYVAAVQTCMTSCISYIEAWIAAKSAKKLQSLILQVCANNLTQF